MSYSLEEIKKENNVTELWSWSKLNLWHTSKYEWFLNYIQQEPTDRNDCIYGQEGTYSHDIIEQFFEHAKVRNQKRITHENQNTDAIIRKILIKEEVDTMVTTLDFLKKKYFDWHLNTLDNILKRLKLMLSNPSDNAVRISTIHRAKGLENNRVFILEYDKLPPTRELEWENIQ